MTATQKAIKDLRDIARKLKSGEYELVGTHEEYASEEFERFHTWEITFRGTV